MSFLALLAQGALHHQQLAQGASLTQPQTHTVTAGETLDQLADRYGVQPQALRDANPHIYRDASPHRRLDAQESGGNMLFGGDVLNIPAAPMSVTEVVPDSGGVNPGFPSPESEYRVGPLTFNPADGSVKLTTEQTRELSRTAGDPHGIGGRTGAISIGAATKQEVSVGETNKDGNTEFTIEVVGDASINGGLEAGGKRGVFLDGSVGAGASFRYKVVLQGENQPVGKALAIDPTDPTTIPEGGTILLDGRQFSRTVFARAFHYVATHRERLDGDGTTFALSRRGDSVSVLAGPTETIESFSGAGVRIGDVTAIAGRQDLLGASDLQAATFDLSSPDGQAAYQHFMTTGQVAHDTPGVSGVARIGRVDMTSQPRLKVDAGALGAIDLAGGMATVSYVRTDYPDGSFTQTLNFKEQTQAGGVPMQITSRFDAEGNEILSERTYAFSIDTSSPGTAEYLDMALGGGGTIKTGDKVTLTFSEGQMRELLANTRTARNAYEIPSTGDHLGILLPGAGVPSGSETAVFATRMGTLMDSYPYMFASRLVDIARGADGDNATGRLVPVDATLTLPS